MNEGRPCSLCQKDSAVSADFSGVKQGDHLTGKPGNVRGICSCQGLGNVRDFTKNQENVREKNLVRENLPKTIYCKLHICIHTGI